MPPSFPLPGRFNTAWENPESVWPQMEDNRIRWELGAIIRRRRICGRLAAQNSTKAQELQHNSSHAFKKPHVVYWGRTWNLPRYLEQCPERSDDANQPSAILSRTIPLQTMKHFAWHWLKKIHLTEKALSDFNKLQCSSQTTCHPQSERPTRTTKTSNNCIDEGYFWDWNSDTPNMRIEGS